MPHVKITNFQKEKNGSSRSEKALIGTIVNQICHSINEGLQKVTSASKKEMLGLSLKDFKLIQGLYFCFDKTA